MIVLDMEPVVERKTLFVSVTTTSDPAVVMIASMDGLVPTVWRRDAKRTATGTVSA